MKIATRDPVETRDRPAAEAPCARVIHARDRQSVRQIRDRVWKAKISKVERIESEEDRGWALIAAQAVSDPNDESVPWDVVRRELGLDRPV